MLCRETHFRRGVAGGGRHGRVELEWGEYKENCGMRTGRRRAGDIGWTGRTKRLEAVRGDLRRGLVNATGLRAGAIGLSDGAGGEA